MAVVGTGVLETQLDNQQQLVFLGPQDTPFNNVQFTYPGPIGYPSVGGYSYEELAQAYALANQPGIEQLCPANVVGGEHAVTGSGTISFDNTTRFCWSMVAPKPPPASFNYTPLNSVIIGYAAFTYQGFVTPIKKIIWEQGSIIAEHGRFYDGAWYWFLPQCSALVHCETVAGTQLNTSGEDGNGIAY